jgi:hypothetical protein
MVSSAPLAAFFTADAAARAEDGAGPSRSGVISARVSIGAASPNSSAKASSKASATPEIRGIRTKATRYGVAPLMLANAPAAHTMAKHQARMARAPVASGPQNARASGEFFRGCPCPPPRGPPRRRRRSPRRPLAYRPSSPPDPPTPSRPTPCWPGRSTGHGAGSSAAVPPCSPVSWHRWSTSWRRTTACRMAARTAPGSMHPR